MAILTSCGTSDAPPETTVQPVVEEGINVPILMYHHFDDAVSSDMIVKEETFEMHMRTLKDAGYTAITFDELIAYVETDAKLHEKVVCITMDDGYLSNYEIAYPILQKYNMNATIFVVGAAVGWTRYRETDHPYIPKFTWAQGLEMLRSGTIDIQCHTYDMHHWPPFEIGDRVIRPDFMPIEGESEEEYRLTLEGDIKAFKLLSKIELGKEPFAFAYPSGKYCDQSERILKEQGFKVTLTTRSHSNRVIKNSPESLYLLGRYTINDSVTAEKLLEIVGGQPLLKKH